tara:strand:- start:360 stop:659 length:300 start_codon:yes stop_codon:yes gene_type:complete
MSTANTVLIETNVPVPEGKQHEKEPLPSLPLKQMQPGQSFLLETRDEEHTRRKLSAVRSAIARFVQTTNQTNKFRVFKWFENGRFGVRVFCVSDDETDQ